MVFMIVLFEFMSLRLVLYILASSDTDAVASFHDKWCQYTSHKVLGTAARERERERVDEIGAKTKR